jgi:hypothetical protein
MPLPREVPAETRRKLVKSYKAGGRVALIGKPYGYDYKTTRRVLVEEGLEIRPAGGPRHPPIAPVSKLLRWHKSGLSCRQIAIRLSTYPNKIADALRDAGHEISDGRTRRGSASPIFKGKRRPEPEGYFTIVLDPHEYWLRGSRSGTDMLEHRLVMARSLGRPLLDNETVHHKNGDKGDNRLVKGHELQCPGKCCNLELWANSHGPGQRVADKVKHAREILKLYGHLHPEKKRKRRR